MVSTFANLLNYVIGNLIYFDFVLQNWGPSFVMYIHNYVGSRCQLHNCIFQSSLSFVNLKWQLQLAVKMRYILLIISVKLKNWGHFGEFFGPVFSIWHSLIYILANFGISFLYLLSIMPSYQQGLLLKPQILDGLKKTVGRSPCRSGYTI